MIPAFVNHSAGTARQARAALDRVGGFSVHDASPAGLGRAIRAELAEQPRPERIVVAGGDGTVGTAAAAIRGTDTQLAILPGGTLNHFARDHGIPTDPEKAARVALDGREVAANVAYVGERLFVNTSSVGAYVTYVRLRERLGKYVGYRLASVLAAARLFFTLRPIEIELDVNGNRKRYSTPLVFVGVGERELRTPTLGNRVDGGQHCLHVLVVRERRAARCLVVALEAATRGLARLAATPELDSFLVDACVVGPVGQSRHVAVDGEVARMATPLHYRLERGALKIVVPAAGEHAGR